MLATTRFGFGHRHRRAEELYMVLEGAGRAKLDEEIIDLRQGDVLRIAPQCVREFEAGANGMILRATGASAGDDSEVVNDFWPATS